MLLERERHHPARCTAASIATTTQATTRKGYQHRLRYATIRAVISVHTHDCADGWETVEVSGFVFKRRRTQPAPAPANPPIPPLAITPANLETLLAACATACTAPAPLGPEFVRRMQAAVEARLKPCVQDNVGLGARLTAKALLHELTDRRALLQGRLQQQQAVCLSVWALWVLCCFDV